MIKGYRAAIICLAIVFLVCGEVSEAGAYWEWTPETGRWIHNRWAARETAETQLAWAEQLRESGRTAEAIQKLRQLVRLYPESPLVPEARLKIGLIHEETGDLRRASLAWQEVLEKHPGSEQSAVAAQKLFSSAGGLIEEKRRFRILPERDKPAERVMAAIEKAPFSEDAEEALYNLGLFKLEKGRPAESVELFDRLAADYPESPRRPDAELQAARALVLLGSGRRYNRGALEEAFARLERWLSRYRENEKAQMAGELLEKAGEKIASMEMETARFYERTGNAGAAQYHYRQVVEKYPGTRAAEKAAALTR